MTFTGVNRPDLYDFRSPFLSARASNGLVRVLIALSAWALIAVHVFRPGLQFYGFKGAFYVAFAIIIAAARARGSKIFSRTPLDLVFILWMLLAVMSQLYASMALFRVLRTPDLQSYVQTILTIWIVYRAAFALACVDPKTAVGSFVKAILGCLGGACLLGIAQGFAPSPIKGWATSIGTQYGNAGIGTELALELTSPRPVALFSGPNIFGFINLVAMAVIVGLIVAQGKSVSTRSVLMACGGLFVFMAGTMAAQSRFAILTAAIVVGYFLYYMIRIGRPQVAVAGIVAIMSVFVGSLLLMQNLELNYLLTTFEQKLTDDDSFRARRQGIEAVVEQAPDLAILGAGYSTRSYSIDRQGDRYEATNSIDNGFLQAFIHHGVPGLVHLFFLLFACYTTIQSARAYRHQPIQALRFIAGLLFVTYILYSFSGVRHSKMETALYWMIIFGLLNGVVYIERWFGMPVFVREEELPAQPRLEVAV